MDTGQPQSETLPPSPPAEPLVLLPAPSPQSAKPEPSFSFRQFLSSAILFGIVVLTLRALAIEPFGVPTGSMASTLYGNHKTCTCPRCGCPVVVGAPNGQRLDANAGRNSYASAWCPNCYQGDLHLDQVPEVVGDRLLVDKSIFEWRKPRRWEVAVFRNPSDLSKPYVKRVVGLPGETVQIREGDVYANNRLIRKTFAECRAMRVLVFDNDFQPQGEGWRLRWRTGAPDSLPANLARDKSLADAGEHLDGKSLKWSGQSPDFDWLVYRHWLIDERREEPIRDWFAYNGGSLRHELNDVHDFQVEFEIETARGASGSFAVKLFDGKDTVTVEIPIIAAGAPARGVVLHGVEAAAAKPWLHLKEGQTHRVEFAFVDRRVMLEIDGHSAFAPVDLPPARQRDAVSRPLWLGAKGASVTVRSLRLYRDIHYSGSGRNAIYDPWPLGPDEYFMLGDNSANSEDSRYWTVPGVPERNFLGKPLLLHQPSRWSRIGGRDLQAIDWGRIKWIR